VTWDLNRVIITATDSAAQQFETVFPEFFIKAFEDPAADLDRNNRVSIWEAFTYASAGVRQWFEQKGQLPTERPLLDDTGAGIGREAQNPGTDGAVARVTYIEPDAVQAHTRPASAAKEIKSAHSISHRSWLCLTFARSPSQLICPTYGSSQAGEAGAQKK